MKELEPLINQVVDLVKGTKDFVLAQAPDFIRQFVIYSYLETVGWLVFSMICLAIVLWFTLWLRRNWDDLPSEGKFFGSLGVVVGGFLSVLATISNIADLFLIWLAPKVYIVTHIAKCLHGGNS